MKSRNARRLHKTSVLAGIITVGLLQHGCLAAAWVAAVCADSMMTSYVTFAPFEASWLSDEEPAQITEGPSLTSVAVLPVEGDADMGRHLVEILQQQTALRIHSAMPIAPDPTGSYGNETHRAVVAKDLARVLAVDAVLFGHVTRLPSHPIDWGWKEEELRRLFLYLVDRNGHLLWKDELPFSVVTGSKPPLDGAVETSLRHHLMDHIRDLGLDTVGYLPQKIS